MTCNPVLVERMSPQVIAAMDKALDALGGPCPACGSLLDYTGPFDGRLPSSGVDHGHEGFGGTYLCEYGHWYAQVLGRLIPPEHILTVVE